MSVVVSVVVKWSGGEKRWSNV
jgi:hypothetical protein